MQRLTRHQLKEDKFAQATAGAVHWTVEHRGKIIGTTVILAVLLAAAIGGWTYLNHRNNLASVEMTKAMRVYYAPIREANQQPDPATVSFTSAEERAKAARKEYQRIASEFPRTRQAEYAKYMAGITAVQSGDNQTGENELKQMADGGNRDVAALSKLALAALYRGTNRTGEAITLYRQLMERSANSVPKVTAQLELAATYEKAQPAEAIKVYQDIKKENEKDQFIARLAETKIQQLGGR